MLRISFARSLSLKRKFQMNLKRYWFLIGLLVILLVAYVKPSVGKTGGPLQPEYTVKYCSAFLLFFFTGYSIKTQELNRVFLSFKIHVFIQIFTFFLMPFLFLLFKHVLLKLGFNSLLADGVQLIGCLPPPVSTGVLLIRDICHQIKGYRDDKYMKEISGETNAIFNSTLGSVLGVFLTPVWMYYLMNSISENNEEDAAPAYSQYAALKSVFLTVLLPLMLGRLANKLIKISFNTSAIINFLIFAQIYTTLCDSFSTNFNQNEDIFDLDEFLYLISSILAIQLTIIFTMKLILSTFKFSFIKSSFDILTIIICGYQKSLTLGIPLIKLLNPTSDSKVIISLSLPMLIYYYTQLLVGGVLVQPLAKWSILHDTNPNTLLAKGV